MHNFSVFVFLFLVCTNIFAGNQRLVGFDSCSLKIPIEYELTVNSEYRKSYMNLGSMSSLMVSPFKEVNTPDRKKVATEIINNLFFEEYRLSEKMQILDESFEYIYRIHDYKIAISLLNIEKQVVIDMINNCR